MSETETVQPWRLESTEQLEEYGVFSVRRDRARSPRTGEVHPFDIVVAADGVTVIALTQQGRMVLVEQYRHALRKASLETPSGLLDQEGEDPAAAALRELREETGYEASGAESLGVLELNPSWETTRVHVVLVRNARPTAEKEQDAGEDTRVRTATTDEVWDLVRSGTINSATVVAALHLWRLRAAEGGGGGPGTR